MSAAIEINEKKLLPIKEASSLVSYSRDYITSLARDKKITAAFIGRQWYVDVDSLKKYEESSLLEAEIRKKQLSDQRKNEQALKHELRKKELSRKDREKILHLKVVSVTSLVLTFGLLTGWLTSSLSQTDFASMALVSNTAQTINNTDSGDAIVTDLSLDNSLNVPNQNSEMSIRPIGNKIANGVLLLPDSPVTASATRMFSDEVVVMKASDGTQVVVRVDEKGNPVGEVMPFVVVPVSHESNI